MGNISAKLFFLYRLEKMNIEHRTSNIEHRTSNIEHRTSNIEHRTSNIEHLPSFPSSSLGTRGWVTASRESKLELLHSCVPKLELGNKKQKICTHRTSNDECEKMKKQTYDLEERLLEYSVRIIKIVAQLPNTRTGNHVATQLLRSGTSPYPNHGEAQAAESPKDFIHKLRISLKELRETQRWLKLIQRVPLIKKPELLDDILKETEELIKIFVTSIKTAEKKGK